MLSCLVRNGKGNVEKTCHWKLVKGGGTPLPLQTSLSKDCWHKMTSCHKVFSLIPHLFPNSVRWRKWCKRTLQERNIKFESNVNHLFSAGLYFHVKAWFVDWILSGFRSDTHIVSNHFLQSVMWHCSAGFSYHVKTWCSGLRLSWFSIRQTIGINNRCTFWQNWLGCGGECIFRAKLQSISYLATQF